MQSAIELKSLKENRRQVFIALIMTALMVGGVLPSAIASFSASSDTSDSEADGHGEGSSAAPQLETRAENHYGSDAESLMQRFIESSHHELPYLYWSDPLAMIGKVSDESLLNLIEPGYGLLAEEPTTGDHDNDGIDDLTDKDDDNDGIYDLIELFDGCYGTDPFDHDNDGLLDHIDLDDDNDGILEGPIDYNRSGLDPWNVSSDRYILSDTIHPWTSTVVGPAYLADQNPWDHDNDGVPDEDSDGNGAGSYDEDDDNDGRIDQFLWPCDFDSDGVQDYFDADDDDDGTIDTFDTHPYNKDITTTKNPTGSKAPKNWEWSDYNMFDAAVDFVAWEAARNPVSPSFTSIYDGDFDNDGIPNFLDPDSDNDETPNNVDTDDDNDGLLDMWDPDDDDDGIKDVCTNLDTNGDGLEDRTGTNQAPYEIPGTDCELDYDYDLDNDRWRPFDQNYNSMWDWFDTDLGGGATPDNTNHKTVGAIDGPWDLDNDQIWNENDSYMLVKIIDMQNWNCETLGVSDGGGIRRNIAYDPALPTDSRCLTERASYTQNNDWDGDGINNWDDIDDDNDGIPDHVDIDIDCDLDNDNDLNLLNGTKFRDDGINLVDIDIDGDGLTNDIDWDDDNDGVNDLYDPDDGNCGLQDSDLTDSFDKVNYPTADGEPINGSIDSQRYGSNSSDFWKMTFMLNPFDSIVLSYNGYDEIAAGGVKSGRVPEFWWYYYSRWSPWSGGNDVDIDADGDSLSNFIDTDQDSDGMPDWWDQDEGGDGILDIHDFKFGGSIDNRGPCGFTTTQGFVCGWEYATFYRMPLQGTQQFSLPLSTRPDPTVTNYEWEFNGAVINSSGYDTDGGGTGFGGMLNNRDLYIAWVGIQLGTLNWLADHNANEFPDELADGLKDDVDPDNDCPAPLGGNIPDPNCMRNDTADLDDDFDSVYDASDIDDDNDGVWDYLEVDSDRDLDDDANIYEPSFYTGTNCIDNDDDGTDTDPDEDGWYQAVWDRGMPVQGYYKNANGNIISHYYDVDNDNDGVPDTEDPDDDNDGVLDVIQEAECFWGEEQYPWDHDNDGVVDWKDDDWDGDGILNHNEPLGTADFWISRWDHDDDGIRDDVDLDDDEDGMLDHDEVLLWPQRFFKNSTNPWDHDDYGGGEALADPGNQLTGPDGFDRDDDTDLRVDDDHDHYEEGFPPHSNCSSDPASSDWDFDNDCILDKDDKRPTRIVLYPFEAPLWLDSKVPSVFEGYVEWKETPVSNWTRAPDLPIQIVIQWSVNQTIAVQSADVLTDGVGEFKVAQFLYPEQLHPAANGTYDVWAEVTEMFDWNGAQSTLNKAGVKANLTADVYVWDYFRSDEQPLWFDFKAHYTADWERQMFDNRLVHAPITFTLRGPSSTPNPFIGGVNYSNGGLGYRTDSNGFASVTYDQTNDSWNQVHWNNSLNNGRGGYEWIIYNPAKGGHDLIGEYNYTPTSLPKGDYEVYGFVDPNLSSSGYYPYMDGDETDHFRIRSVHRMFLNSTLHLNSTTPLLYFDNKQWNGVTFGAWRALLHEPSITASGQDCEQRKIGLSYPICWDGDLNTLPTISSEAVKLMDFVSVNSTHWSIAMLNGGSLSVPPCGPVEIDNPNSDVRCEVVPLMNTWDAFEITGDVKNRTGTPWACPPPITEADCLAAGLTDKINFYVDTNKDGQFSKTESEIVVDPKAPKWYNDSQGARAEFDFNFYWDKGFAAGTYMIGTDFSNSYYYFTGDSTAVASKTGTFNNITVIGYTDFVLTQVPRVYRNSETTLQARLIDNAGLPVASVGVDWQWLGSGTGIASGTVFTDMGGFFDIPLLIDENHPLGEFNLTMTYSGGDLRRGSTADQSVWVVSRTHLLTLDSDTCTRCVAGQRWSFKAKVIDDNRTPWTDSEGENLDGAEAGIVQVIFEGRDKQDRIHRRIMAEVSPSLGRVSQAFQLDPGDIRLMDNTFLPDGFGPVTVYLRFIENKPNEGCAPLNPDFLDLQGGWDECTLIPNSNDYRLTLPYYNDGGGFLLVSQPRMTIDTSVTDIYTSQELLVDGILSQVAKPMIVSGNLIDELNQPLNDRRVRVTWRMLDSDSNGVCGGGDKDFTITDLDGNWTIACDISMVDAGPIEVSASYVNTDQSFNDLTRYENATQPAQFQIHSNSTFSFDRIGAGRNGRETIELVGWSSPLSVMYYKESFHITGWLNQTNGRPLGGRCMNLYLDDIAEPIATITTSDMDGRIDWYSLDDTNNLITLDPRGWPPEGNHTLRLAYEPTLSVLGGCPRDPSAVIDGTSTEIDIYVRSRVKLTLRTEWARRDGYNFGDTVYGNVSLRREKHQSDIPTERVIFEILYLSDNGTWVSHEVMDQNFTNELGIARFGWRIPTGEDNPCGINTCTWAIVARYDETNPFMPVSSPINQTFDVNKPFVAQSDRQGFFSPENSFFIATIAMGLLILAAVMYRRYAERRRVELLRGILTDAMMQLRAANEFIQVIFNCYNELVRFFRKHGFLKKVYETTREFEQAVRRAFHMVPAAQLDQFLAIFEEARYSNHDIGAIERDQAIMTLQAITDSISRSLGSDGMIARTAAHEADIHSQLTKAGEFIDAQGNVVLQGKEETDATAPTFKI